MQLKYLQSITRLTTPWSPRRERRVRERAAEPSKANTGVVVLRNDHIVLFCAVRKLSNSFNVIRSYALSPFLTLRCSFMTDRPKARATPTNSKFTRVGSKVTESWRCARGIHCEYVHLVYTTVCSFYSTHFYSTHTTSMFAVYVHVHGLQHYEAWVGQAYANTLNVLVNNIMNFQWLLSWLLHK